MMYIASVFSQLERETIAERIRDNMRELAENRPLAWRDHAHRIRLQSKGNRGGGWKETP